MHSDSAERQFDVNAIITTGPRTVEFQPLVLPIPQQDEAVVNIEFCGLCTPDQRVYKGSRATYPYWGGHELCGVLERVPLGADSSLRPGVRVALALMARCGQCCACRMGLDNHCAYLHPEARSSLPAGPRGLSDRMAVAPYKLFPVPEGPPAEFAALVEPIACALRSIRLAVPGAGETAAVIGAGTMGLLHAVLLTLRGSRVFVYDEDPRLHGQSMRAGASFFGSLEDLRSGNHLDALTNGWGFDSIFCTRFGVVGVETAVRAAARGGRVVLYQSIPKDSMLTLDLNYLHYREIRLLGTIAQTIKDVADAVKILATQWPRFDCLHLETVRASRPSEAFETALKPEVNRVLVDFRSL